MVPVAKLDRAGVVVTASSTSVQYALLERGLAFGNNDDRRCAGTGLVARFGPQGPRRPSAGIYPFIAPLWGAEGNSHWNKWRPTVKLSGRTHTSPPCNCKSLFFVAIHFDSRHYHGVHEYSPSPLFMSIHTSFPRWNHVPVVNVPSPSLVDQMGALSPKGHALRFRLPTPRCVFLLVLGSRECLSVRKDVDIVCKGYWAGSMTETSNTSLLFFFCRIF